MLAIFQLKINEDFNSNDIREKQNEQKEIFKTEQELRSYQFLAIRTLFNFLCNIKTSQKKYELQWEEWLIRLLYGSYEEARQAAIEIKTQGIMFEKLRRRQLNNE